MNLTVEDWSGEFGDAYTERNLTRGIGRGMFWRGLIDGHRINSVLEVGCNNGQNLVGLDVPCTGVDVNDLALELVPNDIKTYKADATDLPFGANEFDLVFTFGVLIHIPPDELETAMREIVRVSRHYVFAGEYLGDDTVPYRNEVLWRRDYGALYQEIGLELVDQGVLEGEPWDKNRVDWWLLHQPQPTKEPSHA